MMPRLLAAFFLAAGPVLAADYAEDAALRAVHFVDENEGWAVGDQGAIYRTMNKGVNWDRQPSGTAAMLTGVRMLNTHEGLIVGAQGRMYDRGASGVVLGTGNGGFPWLPVSMGGRMPGLRGLAIGDRERGWAWGDASDQNPAGLFSTSDFGKTWNPLRTARYPGWKSGALFDGANGFVGGADRSLAAIRGGVVKPLETAWLPGTSIRGMARAGGRVWAVGERAQIMRSEDAGVTWSAAAPALPPEARNVVDFHAVAARGEHVWVVGRPGSVILHSADAGRTWERQGTGVAAPLYAVAFPTDLDGHAVGAYGVRLRTEDGGKNWKYAGPHQAPPRSAALFVVASGADLPMAALARYGLDQGYHCTALAVCGPDLAKEPLAAAVRPDRFAEGVRLAGGVLGETLGLFPLAADRLDDLAPNALAAWNPRLDGKAYDEMVRSLTLAIRMHRPRVIVTHAAQAAGPNEEPRGLIGRAVYAAIAAARAEDQMPELQDSLGLEPHAVNKVYALGTAEGAAMVALDAGEIAERLGQTYASAASAGLAACAERRVEADGIAHFALVASGKADAENGKSLFAGLNLAPGDEARRVLRGGAELGERERQQLQSRQNALALLDQGDTVMTPEQSVASLKLVARTMKPVDAARTIHRFIRRFADRGQWELAQDASEFLVASFPEQPAAVDACQWLVSYSASGEARHRLATADAARPAADAAPSDQRGCKRALAAADALQEACPEMWGDARMRLVQAAAARRLRADSAAKTHLDAVAALDPRAGWQDVAAQELFALAGRAGAAEPPLVNSALVRSRPKLDGLLDDDIWKGEPAVKLLPPADAPAGYAAEVTFRHDQDYLYVAARCPYPNAACRKDAIARTAENRDLNLAAADRIEIMLDLDRDYSTWWRFTVDQQGRVADDCWGDKTWNPKWHVATAADDKEWRLEIAIPFAEIMPKEQARDLPMAVGVQRVAPGRGVFALRQPAAAMPRPETFRLLRLARHAEALLGQ